jgi:hypothetical protein
MTGERLPPDEIRTGAAYESARPAARTRLAEAADARRVPLGDDLVLVFETGETIRAALEELLRAERVVDPGRLRAEAGLFAQLRGGEHELAATLYVDVADAAALADRLAELAGVGGAVSMGLAGHRVPARVDHEPDGAAVHLRFPLDAAQRAALLDGAAVDVEVDHPGCRARAALGTDAVRAISADLRR